MAPPATVEHSALVRPNDVQAHNEVFYEGFWQYFGLFRHDGWSAWPEIAPFVGPDRRALEIGPGMFPHLPPERSWFVDLSTRALLALRERGGTCVRATSPLPFPDASFDVVALFEVLEHVADDQALLGEIARVLRPGGVLFFSCPMNPAYWTFFDRVVGHVRRYRAADLEAKLAAHGFAIERVCARHDRMDRWFGGVFGFGVRYLPRLTARIVEHYLPKVAAIPWAWQDSSSLGSAEGPGGLTARARRL